MPVMPAWALALLIVLQEAPAIAAAIDLGHTPELTGDQMAVLQQARDAAIAEYAAATNQTT